MSSIKVKQLIQSIHKSNTFLDPNWKTEWRHMPLGVVGSAVGLMKVCNILCEVEAPKEEIYEELITMFICGVTFEMQRELDDTEYHALVTMLSQDTEVTNLSEFEAAFEIIHSISADPYNFFYLQGFINLLNSLDITFDYFYELFMKSAEQDAINESTY